MKSVLHLLMIRIQNIAEQTSKTQISTEIPFLHDHIYYYSFFQVDHDHRNISSVTIELKMLLLKLSINFSVLSYKSASEKRIS